MYEGHIVIAVSEASIASGNIYIFPGSRSRGKELISTYEDGSEHR
jgi:hypothetical protein